MTNSKNKPNQHKQVNNLKEALLESVEKFHAFADYAPVGIYLDDVQGNAIFVNNKCAELIGIPAEKALNFGWEPYLHPDDRELMVSEWTKAFTNNSTFRLEYRWVHKDGKIVWTLGEVVPILDDDGKVILFIGTLTDITPRKEAEIEKEKLQAQLLQAQKLESVGRLAGGVAHDVNNMLQVILGNTEMALKDVDPSEPVHDNLQEIIKVAESSAEITRQLLAFARKEIISTKVFDINKSLDTMLNLIRRLIGEDIDLKWLPKEGQIPIKMDPSQLHQLVVNLCINARDAIDGIGKIEIATVTLTLDEKFCADHMEAVPGEFCMLSIKDNGIGMNNETLKNIFEPFFTTKDENMGTGLGLATVYGTVKQNQGFIDVESTIGTGTTFKIYLPIHKGEITETKQSQPVNINKGSGEIILIVEDQIAILKVTQLILETMEYKVLTANTLSEALELVSHYKDKISLLITDLIMPEINGRDLAKQLRSDNPDLKCMYMSGYTADIITDKGALEENDDFIQKPFKVEDLIAKVNKAMS